MLALKVVYGWELLTPELEYHSFLQIVIFVERAGRNSYFVALSRDLQRWR